MPLGIAAAAALIPDPLMREFRERAEALSPHPAGRIAVFVIVGIWIAMLVVIAGAAWEWLSR